LCGRNNKLKKEHALQKKKRTRVNFSKENPGTFYRPKTATALKNFSPFEKVPRMGKKTLFIDRLSAVILKRNQLFNKFC